MTAKAHASALGAGALFGVGLGVAGMTSPAKVQAFLDFFGEWDPSLALVMVGAIAVHALGRLVVRRSAPLFDTRFHLPTRNDLDRPLVLGAALFGLGWGLGGFCPGPGIVSLASGTLDALVFVGAMAAGMALHFRLTHTAPPAAAVAPVPAPEAEFDAE
jgi:uncharacterized membrane protein YedE/YeeE